MNRSNPISLEIQRGVVALLAALLLWSVFTWPLPRLMDRAIPDGSQAYGGTAITSMSPGDHLQYLYYLALARDMMLGHTEWFHNVYEFNTGDDAARFEPDPYFFPFCLLFTLLAFFVNLAAAWNLLGLMSIWLSLWVTWALARRYTDRHWVAALAALVFLALPYRWANLLGGSTMGPAFLWTPVVMLGIDLAVRDHRRAGAAIAGVALLLALWSDMHVFFFTSLLAPGWCVIALIKHDTFAWREPRAYLRQVVTLLPVPLFLVGGIALKHLYSRGPLVAERTRTWNEAAMFSPHFSGVFGFETGVTGHIHLGYGLVGLLILGLAAIGLLVRARHRRSFPVRDALLFGVLLSGIMLILLLALGTYGPHGGRMFDWARIYVPFYANIRQSAKIYCLMPPVLSVFAVVCHGLAVTAFRRVPANVVWAALGATIMFGGYRHVAISMTWLDLEQGAYAAVAEDAVARDQRPGAIVIPLWPGDSHYSSVYQMYALQHRIRMMNGYRPMARAAYREDIATFSSVNQGVLTDAQIDELIRRGIHYLIVHQNLFPEGVSPFPVGQTLLNLVNHPRVEKLAQDERVWSFRLLSEPVLKPMQKPEWTPAFPARRQEAERLTTNTQAIMTSADAGHHAYVAMSPGVTVSGQTVRVARRPDVNWMIRVRGTGTVSTVIAGSVAQPISIDAAEWTWLHVPVRFDDVMIDTHLELVGQSGLIDVDVMILAAGAWPDMAPGESIHVGAARFFHAGFMDMDSETVTLEQGVDHDGIAWYGPKLPFPSGRYDVELLYTTSAPDGTSLGLINLEQDEMSGAGVTVPVVAGQPARGIVERISNLPFNMVFVFSGQGDVQLESVRITRIE